MYSTHAPTCMDMIMQAQTQRKSLGQNLPDVLVNRVINALIKQDSFEALALLSGVDRRLHKLVHGTADVELELKLHQAKQQQTLLPSCAPPANVPKEANADLHAYLLKLGYETVDLQDAYVPVNGGRLLFLAGYARTRGPHPLQISPNGLPSDHTLWWAYYKLANQFAAVNKLSTHSEFKVMEMAAGWLDFSRVWCALVQYFKARRHHRRRLAGTRSMWL